MDDHRFAWRLLKERQISPAQDIAKDFHSSSKRVKEAAEIKAFQAGCVFLSFHSFTTRQFTDKRGTTSRSNRDQNLESLPRDFFRLI
ncbi:hypothetical protein TNIN_239171 [Trichonephila inaurata madagascariensis]|uniref:Uncharacterized protein n=1 Tax=Trichonephila inaurata madagascariensis TaxID=2747483 RepID=A0A8X6Y254_9ARAC|nr:hypothetical protein TNIN_239171 [Trichonephila inaurata madagascariensis]